MGEEPRYQIKKPSCLDWYHVVPPIGCLLLTLCQTSPFVICRQCAQMFSVVLGEEATAEILQCKRLGNAAVHQVPRGGEGGRELVEGRERYVPWRKAVAFPGESGEGNETRKRPFVESLSCPLPLSHVAVRKSIICCHSHAPRGLSPGSHLKEL